jgi:hypothetical protein
MASTFADRLWWARHRAGLGATRLARLVKCSQSLISSLERNNANRSTKSDAFAKVLNVDPAWLAHGFGQAPEGFDEERARRGRENQSTERETVRLPPEEPMAEPLPRWAEPPSTVVMKSQIFNLVIDFARAAGREQAVRLIDTLGELVENVAVAQEPH